MHYVYNIIHAEDKSLRGEMPLLTPFKYVTAQVVVNDV